MTMNPDSSDDANLQRELIDRQFRYEMLIKTKTQAMEALSSALRSLLVLNGGAAVALLALAASMLGTGSNDTMRLLVGAVGLFALGAASTGLAAAAFFVSELGESLEVKLIVDGAANWQKDDASQISYNAFTWTLVFGIAAFVLFLAGLAMAAWSLLR